MKPSLSLRRGVASVALSCVMGMWSAACADTGGDQVCTPGTTQECVCPDGMGAQACNDAGNGYDACMCGSDSGDTSDDSGTDSAATDSADTTDTTDATDTTDSTDSTDTTDSTDSTTTSTDSTTGNMGDWVFIQNDGFVDGANVGAQAGFAMDECWASTYKAPDNLYPFEVVGMQALIAGLNTDATFSVRVWEVDGSGKPTTGIGTLMEGQFMGSDTALNEADFVVLGEATPVVVDAGEFAIAVCHSTHAGAPSIARDDDGSVLPGKNWIYANLGGTFEWVEASSVGVNGDWIMRAAVLPQ